MAEERGEENGILQHIRVPVNSIYKLNFIKYK